jgi:hypothetical protein
VDGIWTGVSGVAHKKWSGAALHNVIFVRVIALITMCLSIFMAIYAAINFKMRGDMLQCVSTSSLILCTLLLHGTLGVCA